MSSDEAQALCGKHLLTSWVETREHRERVIVRAIAAWDGATSNA